MPASNSEARKRAEGDMQSIIAFVDHLERVYEPVLKSIDRIANTLDDIHDLQQGEHAERQAAIDDARYD